ncbi:MAG: radical SAM protein [Actinomycetota bacterium]
MGELRWQLTDEERDGQLALFGIDGLIGPQRGTGRLSGLEFLHVAAKQILNPVPALSRMPFRWTINVYRGCSHACRYCFARPTHEYLGLSLGEDFDRKIVVKVNAVEKVRAELAAPGWTGEPIAMGTNTDPYQRSEGKYRLTRGVVEALAEHANPFSILTKSALVTRDLDVLVAAARRADVTVNFSIPTLDEAVWRATEPGTPNPQRRIDAMRQVAAAGIKTGALIAPVLPGLSDRPDQVAEVVRAVQGAGGRVLGAMALHLRPGTREHFLTWLAEHDPTLHASYLRRYATSDYAPHRYTDRLRAMVADAQSSSTLPVSVRAG